MTLTFILYLLVMAGTTYLLRMIPLVFMKNKIESEFITRFLYYIPYTVLGAMTFPAIIYATSYMTSAIVGALVALFLAYIKGNLLVVSIGTTKFIKNWELVSQKLQQFIFNVGAQKHEAQNLNIENTSIPLKTGVYTLK